MSAQWLRLLAYKTAGYQGNSELRAWSCCGELSAVVVIYR
jgi:hypothetical protein